MAEPSAAPGNLSVHFSNVVTVSWSQLNCSQRNGPISGYLLHIQSKNTSDNAVYNNTVYLSGFDNTTHGLTNLPLRGVYTFMVAAVNDAGMSIFSNPVEADIEETNTQSTITIGLKMLYPTNLRN